MTAQEAAVKELVGLVEAQAFEADQRVVVVDYDSTGSAVAACTAVSALSAARVVLVSSPPKD